MSYTPRTTKAYRSYMVTGDATALRELCAELEMRVDELGSLNDIYMEREEVLRVQREEKAKREHGAWLDKMKRRGVMF